MKKIVLLTLGCLLAFTLSACTTTKQSEKQATITITALNAEQQATQIEVPYDPQRIVILDMPALDILDNLGLGDRIVGSATTSLEYLQSYVNDKNIANVGTIKTADLEAVMKCDPDIIFIGGRLSASYEALSQIAPVVYLATDTDAGLVKSVEKNATTIASIFGKEADVAAKMEGFAARITKLQEIAQANTAVIGMSTSGSFNLLGNDGRCSIIGNEIGFTNIAASSTDATATHGNETSFELLVKLNPQYIFVMDRDAAIGTDGAQLAKDIVENELTMKTDAYQNNNIVYLAHPAVWYTAEGGITALDIMLQDIENAL